MEQVLEKLQQCQFAKIQHCLECFKDIDVINKNKPQEYDQCLSKIDIVRTKPSKVSLNKTFIQKAGGVVKKLDNQDQSFLLEIITRDETELSKPRRYIPSGTKEWYISKYTYNKQEMSSILGLDITVTKLIKAYFTSRPCGLKKRKSGSRIWMTNKIYTSKPELKHTSRKVTTILYIFAGIRFNLTYLYRYLNEENFEDFSLSKVKQNNLLDLKNFIDNNTNLGKNFEFLKRNKKRIEKLNKLEKQLENMRNNLDNQISKSYKKKQEIKLIRLKYLYLNNHMLSEYIALRLRSKKKSLFRVKSNIFRKIRLPFLDKNAEDQISVARKKIIVTSLQNKTRKSRAKIIWNEWRKNEYFRPALPWNITKFNDSHIDFLNYIKYKFPVGIRLAIAGRLTKRNVASRSMSKFTYIGSIKDIDSSYKNLSVPTLRGDIKASLDFTRSDSLAKTGAFTVKSWLSKHC